MISLLKYNLLFSSGISIVWCLLIAGILSFFIYRPLLIVVIALFIFSLYFFRNPKRVCIEALQDDAMIMSPADGKVVAVQSNGADMPEGYKGPFPWFPQAHGDRSLLFVSQDSWISSPAKRKRLHTGTPDR